MANSKYLRWINDDQITTKIAQRFVAFCEEDVEQRANTESFDADIYQDAMKLIINRFEGNSPDGSQIESQDDKQKLTEEMISGGNDK